MNGGHPVGGSPIGSQVAYWKLNEMQGTTAYDYSPNANNLTLNTASWTSSGKFGGAWNGTGGAFRMSKTTDNDLEFGISDDFSLSFWFKSDNATNPATAIEYLVSDTTGNTDVGYSVYLNTNGTLCFGIDDDTSWGPDVSSCTPNDVYDGLWHHVTAIRDYSLTDKLYLYVDALLKDSDSDTTTSTLDGNNVFYIGDIDTDDAAANEEFAGDIDEFKVYRAALTPNQVKTEFNQGKSIVMGSLSANSSNAPQNGKDWNYCPPGSAASCTGPIHEYMMDEKTGTTTLDTGSGSTTRNLTLTLGGTYVPGKYGSGIQMDGVDSYLSPGAFTELFEETTAFTLSSWVYITSLASDAVIIGDSSGAYTTFFISANWQGVTNGLHYCASPTCAEPADGKSISNVISLNTWQYVTMTYNGTDTCKFYVNGVDVTSDGACGEESSLYSHVIGGAIAPSYSTFGTFDHVRTYNYVLTPAQIVWEFNRGAPVAWYKFDECSGIIIKDWGPNGNGGYNGNTGTLTLGASPASGTCTTSGAWFNGATGKVNASMDFDGSDDYIVVPYNSKLVAPQMSFSVWVNVDSYPISTTREVLRKEGSYSIGYGTDGTADPTLSTWDIGIKIPTIVRVFVPIKNIPAGQWNHIAFTADGTTLKVYINGKLFKPTTSYSGNIADNASNNLFLGTYGTTTPSLGRWFNGKVDDVRIFNYALTAQQIRDVYNNGAVSFK
jgi:hypothetical protein